MSKITVITPEYLDDTLVIDNHKICVNIDNTTIQKDENGVLKAIFSKSVTKGILGEPIAAGFLVYANNELYYKFNASDVTLYDRLVGMANQTGGAGAEIDIVTDGICDGIDGLTPNKMYFAANGGAISLTPPTSGLRISVGTSIASNKFNVKIKDSIIRI